MTSKRCPRCNRVKPMTAYNVDRARPDGRTSWCRECHHGRTQVVAHLDDHIAERLRTVARNRGLTLREAVTDAVCLYLADRTVDDAIAASLHAAANLTREGEA